MSSLELGLKCVNIPLVVISALALPRTCQPTTPKKHPPHQSFIGQGYESSSNELVGAGGISTHLMPAFGDYYTAGETPAFPGVAALTRWFVLVGDLRI